MGRTAINITTIHVPEFMDGLCKNIKENGHDPDIIVIGDFKTPPETKKYCSAESKKYKLNIQYLGLTEQEDILKGLIPKKYIDLMELFSCNTPDRIILGGMISYLMGCERMIAVDDDNYATDSDFVGFHESVGTTCDLRLIKTRRGWYNVHGELNDVEGVYFYPRGFPWGHRFGNYDREDVRERRRVVVNQGLVLGDPDIDAIQRLAHPINAVSSSGGVFGLAPGTWSPFNFQNTCLMRELIPCYFRPKSTSRNADIWTAYVFNRLAQHFGDVITFGEPLVKQVRNSHNLWKDLDLELMNNRATDVFVDLIRNLPVEGKNYFDALCSLINAGLKSKIPMVDSPEKDMIKAFFIEYADWCKVVGEII